MSGGGIIVWEGSYTNYTKPLQVLCASLSVWWRHQRQLSCVFLPVILKIPALVKARKMILTLLKSITFFRSITGRQENLTRREPSRLQSGIPGAGILRFQEGGSFSESQDALHRFLWQGGLQGEGLVVRWLKYVSDFGVTLHSQSSLQSGVVWGWIQYVTDHPFPGMLIGQSAPLQSAVEYVSATRLQLETSVSRSDWSRVADCLSVRTVTGAWRI